MLRRHTMTYNCEKCGSGWLCWYYGEAKLIKYGSFDDRGKRKSLYNLLRAYGNSRLQSLVKDVAWLVFGKSAYINPKRWL